jgi:signal recognition particle receptor subunit beta
MPAPCHGAVTLSPSRSFVLCVVRIVMTGMTTRHVHHILHALTSLPPSQPVPSLLILAHKYDLLKLPSSAETSPSSMAIARVRTVLARELTNRRRSQLSRVGVEGLGEEEEDGKGEMGGLECVGESEKFDWDQWEGGTVQFAGTWLRVGEDDEKNESEEVEVEEGLEPLAEWINELS